MADELGRSGRLPAVFTTPGGSSFSDFLSSAAPHLLPGGRTAPTSQVTDLPHGTTIVAATYDGGVIMAGDRRATVGNVIAQRDIRKVFQTDEFSCVGIAGTAGLAIEMVRLFQVELEHYEKLEGATLSLDGKANRLSAMIRNNLAMAMQGLAVVPLFAGYDLVAETGRIFSYDVTGGRYEQDSFHTVGSGSVFARGSLKKLYREGAGLDETVRALLQALYDAADDDSATGGPDLSRSIFPVVLAVSAEGTRTLTEDEIAGFMRDIVDQRASRPDGPAAG